MRNLVFGSSLWSCSVRERVLWNFAKLTGKHLWQKLWHRCFPVNFTKFLRAPFLTEHLWGNASGFCRSVFHLAKYYWKNQVQMLLIVTHIISLELHFIRNIRNFVIVFFFETARKVLSEILLTLASRVKI